MTFCERKEMIDTNKEREAFDEWLNDPHYNYTERDRLMMFDAWQARAVLAASPVPLPDTGAREAGKVEAVADEAVGTVWYRNNFPEDSEMSPIGPNVPDGKYKLYLHPSQPEPTSKGASLLPACEGELSDAMGVEWFDDGTPSDEKPASPTAGMTLADRIVHVGGRQNDQGYIEFGSYMAVNALIQHVLRDLPPSQQREPQEAAEQHRQLMAIVDAFGSSYRDGLPTEGLRARISKGIRAALSATQEAGKAEPDMRAICEALGFDPTNHHNAAKCPYCRPPESKEAGKVEAVADEREAKTIGEAMEKSGLIYFIKDGDLAHSNAAVVFAHLMAPSQPRKAAEPVAFDGRQLFIACCLAKGRSQEDAEHDWENWEGDFMSQSQWNQAALYLRPSQQALSEENRNKT